MIILLLKQLIYANRFQIRMTAGEPLRLFWEETCSAGMVPLANAGVCRRMTGNRA
jgi:hypothetical protein